MGAVRIPLDIAAVGLVKANRMAAARTIASWSAVSAQGTAVAGAGTQPYRWSTIEYVTLIRNGVLVTIRAGSDENIV